MPKKSTIFRCPNCKVLFGSQESLSCHGDERLHIYNDSSCIDSLFQCEFCKQRWPNQKSLSHHMMFNPKCKRIQNLHDNMSKLMPECYGTQELLSSKAASYSSAIDHSHNTSHNDGIVYCEKSGFNLSLCQFIGNDKAPKRQKLCSPTPQQKFVEETDASPYVSQLLNSADIQTLSISQVQQFVHDNRSSYDDTLSSHAALFYNKILSLSKKTTTGVIRGTLKSMLLELKNTLVRISMETGMESLPGFHSTFHFSDVSDETMALYLLKHNETSLRAHEEQTGIDSDNVEDQEESHGVEEHDEFITHNMSSEMLMPPDDSVTPLDENIDVENVINVGNDTRSVDTTMNNICEHVKFSRKTSLYDSSEIAMIELNNMLQKAGAPLYLFDQLTSWCKKSSGVFHNQRIPSRDTFLKSMSEKVYGNHMTKCLKPRLLDHKLPSGRTIVVTSFSFKAKLCSILMNEELMQEKNLLLNADNPFRPPEENMMLEDVNSGWWCRETWHEVCKHPDEILCPIIFFIDGGKVTKRLSVEPLTFTLGFFKREVRNSVSAWRTLGYMEDLFNCEDPEENGGTLNGSKIQSSVKVNDYHSILHALLSEFKTLQGVDSGLEWNLDIGGKTHRVIFKFAVQVVLGDCKGNNVLCGQFGGHSLQSKRLCRDCMVSPNDADDPEHVCTFVSLHDVKDKSKNELKLMSMHKINNAFDDIYFGARRSSIYSCTPPEPLHGVLLGTVKYLFEEFERTIPKSTLQLINRVVPALYRNHSCQSLKDMPSLVCFQSSINKCDVLTAKQQYARLFAIFLSLHIPCVFRSLSNDLRKKRVDDIETGTHSFQDKDPIGLVTAKKWFFLIESSLTMYQWIMKDSHPPHTLRDHLDEGQGTLLESMAQRALRQYMRDYKSLIGNRSGHGLKINKYHQLLHYVREILKDGSIENIDTGICEGLAVFMYKKLVVTTQKRQRTLIREVANRHLECLVLSECNRLCQDIVEHCPSNVWDTFKGTRYRMTFVQDLNAAFPSGDVTVQWYTETKDVKLSPQLYLSLANRLFLNTSDGGCLDHLSSVLGFTEYVDNNGYIYRAHPNYRGKGIWCDWCLVRWEGIDQLIPARIITFIDLTNSKLMSEDDLNDMVAWMEEEGIDQIPTPVNSRRTSYLSNEKWVVLQSCMTDAEQIRSQNVATQNVSQHSLSSQISTRWRLENQYRLLPITCISSPTYCIPIDILKESDEHCEYIQILDKSMWSCAFLPER